MNRKTIVVLLLLTAAILAGAPESFATPQYQKNLTAVYGTGTCGTCHVMPSGGGHYNGTSGQHSNFNRSNGQYNNTNRQFSRNGNGTFRQGNSNITLPLNSYGTLFANQPDHAADPGAALMAIGQPPVATATPGDTPADTAVTGTKAAPGFGFTVALVGLIACVLLARRHNK